MGQKRGMLTDRVNAKSKELLGYEMEQKELRLMPYILYVMTNNQKLDPNHIDGEERKIIRKWKDKGYVEGGAAGLTITKKFWNIVTEIMFLGYVDLD